MREVRSDGSFMSHNDLRVHFGLAAAIVAQVKIRWPDGRWQELPDLESNHFYTVQESKGVIWKRLRR